MTRTHRLLFNAVFSATMLAALSLSAEPLKVLMIGNSFSHSVLVQLPKIAHDNGDELLIENLMIPGCTLAQHAENIAKAEKDQAFKPYNCDRLVDGKQLPRTKTNIQAALRQEKWDVVTIQQGSSKCFDAVAYHPCGEEVLATIRKLAPQAKIMFQMTWSYNELDRRVRDRLTGGRGWFNITRAEMFELIKGGVYPFAVSKGRAGFACETVTYTLAADGTLTAEWLPIGAEKKEKVVGQAPVEPGATLRLGIIRDNGGTCLWHFMTNGVEFARGDTVELKPVGNQGGEDAYNPLFVISQGDATMDDFSLKIPVDAAESPNLVINSSFEHDADGFPPYYARWNNFDLSKWRCPGIPPPSPDTR